MSYNKFYRTTAGIILLVGFCCYSSVAECQKIDRDSFYLLAKTKFPLRIFRGEALKTFEKVFDYWDTTSFNDLRWLAYILATAYRESAGTMLPIREALCKTDQGSINSITAYINKKNEKRALENKTLITNYALPDKNGHSYFGRGLVQLTGKGNYERVGKILGWGSELVDGPGAALELDRSVKILIEGCIQGLFTCRKMSNYFNEKKTDWVNARNIVNPKSERKEITAQHGIDFYSCLKPANK
jgi:predicted chitinase